MIKIILVFIIIGLELYSLCDSIGLFEHKYRQGFFGWYTNLSNILVFVYFILVMINALFTKISIVNNSVIALSVTLAIIMTFLIYHFILSPPLLKMHKEGTLEWNFYRLENLSLHYICPLLTLVYWIFFANKEGLTVLSGLYWTILPTTYVFYAYIRAALGFRFLSGERYPYDFMNKDKIGMKKVIRNVVVIIIVFAILGLILAQIGVWINSL